MNTVPDKCQFCVGSTVCVKGDQLGITTWNGSFEQTVPVTFAILGETKTEIAEGALAGRLLVIQGRGRLAPEDAWILKGKPACVLIVQEDSRVRNEAVNQNEQTPSAYPAAMVIRTAANALAAACGQPAELFAGGDIKESKLIASDKTVDAHLVVEREPVDMPNVVGWYPGSDKTVANQHIIVGAHLDYLGVQRGELFPGADDNASGTAVILELARALTKAGVRPQRTILFASFSGEERDLLGSRLYTAHAPIPLSSTRRWSISITREPAMYNALYGSIGTIIVLMALIFINSLVLLIGFELNVSIKSLKAIAEKRDALEKTLDAEKKLHERS